MAEDYLTVEQLKTTLQIDDAFADDDIQLAITAASRGVDDVCRRRFWQDDTADQVRYYTPDDPRELQVDDLVALTELATAPAGDAQFTDVWTTGTDLVLEPLNAPADTEPYTSILVHPLSSYRLPCYPASVRVTGRFGWPEIPAGVTQATVILASKLLRRAREAPFGVVSFGMDGGAAHIARTDPDIMFLIGDLIHTRIAVA